MPQDESDKLPFPNDESEFQLPTEFTELLDERIRPDTRDDTRDEEKRDEKKEEKKEKEVRGRGRPPKKDPDRDSNKDDGRENLLKVYVYCKLELGGGRERWRVERKDHRKQVGKEGSGKTDTVY